MKRHVKWYLLVSIFCISSIASAQLSGSYDIGGGNNDFPDLVTAAAALNSLGMTGPVALNIYSGTYNGQVSLPNTIVGLGVSNPLTIQPAPGQSPIISAPSGGAAFDIAGADYITIQNLEITNCYGGAFICREVGTDSASHCRFIGNYIHNVGTGQTTTVISCVRVVECEIIGNEVQGGTCSIQLYFGRGNVVANNMLYGVTNVGMYFYVTNNLKCYHNSVYMAQNYAFYMRLGNNVSIKNNILYQAGSGNHWAFYLEQGLPAICDYNDLYAPNAHVGFSSNTNRTTLANWQAATGLDAHSISALPNFASTTTGDLHISLIGPSPVDSAGTPVAEVTTDFDGEPRDPTYPDIGADEFSIGSEQYCVTLQPSQLEKIVNAEASYNYMVTIGNCGQLNDTYNLSISITQQPWNHQILDNTGTTTIDSISITAGAIDSFIVQVTVASGARGPEYSIGKLVAQSRYGSLRNTLADTSILITRTPLTGDYDIGGGNNDFDSPFAACTAALFLGVQGHTIFNAYTSTYNSPIKLLEEIPGCSASNTVTFQAAPGETPALAPFSHAVYLKGVDYLTIEGFDITTASSGSGIYCIYNSTTTNYTTHMRFINNRIHDITQSTTYAGIHIFHGIDCEIIGNEISQGRHAIYVQNCDRTLVANNMCYDNNDEPIYMDGGNDNEFYYNSVYSDIFTCFTKFCGINTIIKNNIFYMDGEGVIAMEFQGDTSLYPVSSDYNNLYSPHGYVAYYYTAGECSLLVDWQNRTGFDMHSISQDPHFCNTIDYNLHVLPTSPCDSMGTPISGITTDLDGELRDPDFPDIGADEFVASELPEAIDDLVITLSSSTDDSTNITLIWSPTSNAQQYHVYKSTTDPNIEYIQIGSTTETTYTDTNAIMGESKSFYYVTSDNQASR